MLLGAALATTVVAVPIGAAGASAAAGRTIDTFDGTGVLFSLETTPLGNLLVGTSGDGEPCLPPAECVTGVYAVEQSAADPQPTLLHELTRVQGVSMAPSGGIWAVTGGSVPQDDTGQGIYYLGAGQAPELVANLFTVESTLNPDGAQPFDSNPVAIEQLGDGAAVVADGGANAVWRVDRSGAVEVVAVLPPEIVSSANLKALAGCPASGSSFCGFPDTAPAQGVATSIAIGPDGAYYVGELKGMPAPTGESRIWRIAPGAQNAQCGSSPDCTLVFDGGFTSIMDLEFGPDGKLYVAELDEASWAAVEIFGTPTAGTVSACDLATGECTVVADDIPVVTDITFDGDGALWAIHDALTPAAGLVQLTDGDVTPPPPPPGSVEADVTITVDVPELPTGDGPLLLTVPADASITLAPASGGGALVAEGVLDGVQVDDQRAANPGWNLSAHLGGPSGTPELARDEGPTDDGVDASMFGLTSYVVSSAAGQTVAAGPAVEPGDLAGGVPALSAGASVAFADAGQGAGAAVLCLVLDVEIPSSVEPGTYGGVLTLTAI